MLFKRKNKDQNNKISWKKLTPSYNKGSMVSMTRTSSQLKERWENTLKKSFKRFYFLNYFKIIY